MSSYQMEVENSECGEIGMTINNEVGFDFTM